MNGRGGHRHSAAFHLVGMLTVGAMILVGLVVAGRSWGEVLPVAALLAFPLMMIGMVFMMGGPRGHGRGRERGEATERDTVDAASPTGWGGADG